MIQDDGIGLPETVEPQSSKTFGLMLVRMLAEQLEGRLVIENNGGTHNRLEFEP